MIFISGRSEILDFGTYPVFSRKISAFTTQFRESATFIIFIFLSKRISSLFHFLFLSLFSFSFNLHHKFLYFIPKLLHLTLHLTTFHTLPLISTTQNLHLTTSLASLYWPRRTPHPPLGKPLLAKGHLTPYFTQNPLSSI